MYVLPKVVNNTPDRTGRHPAPDPAQAPPVRGTTGTGNGRFSRQSIDGFGERKDFTLLAAQTAARPLGRLFLPTTRDDGTLAKL
jgi:hypothetical protein